MKVKIFDFEHEIDLEKPFVKKSIIDFEAKTIIQPATQSEPQQQQQ